MLFQRSAGYLFKRQSEPVNNPIASGNTLKPLQCFISLVFTPYQKSPDDISVKKLAVAEIFYNGPFPFPLPPRSQALCWMNALEFHNGFRSNW